MVSSNTVHNKNKEKLGKIIMLSKQVKSCLEKKKETEKKKS